MASSDVRRPAVRLAAGRILFDLDGTLIDSTQAVTANWERWSREHGIAPDTVLAMSHGRRTVDVIRELHPGSAPDDDLVHAIEAAIPRTWGHLVRPLPNASELLREATRQGIPWTIVTSGTIALAGEWIKMLSFPQPEFMVTGDQVSRGKPDPACYLLAMSKLDSRPGATVVFEDAPAGIRAGKAAGCTVVAVCTSHTLDQVAAAGPDYVVADLNSVLLEDGMLRLEDAADMKQSSH